MTDSATPETATPLPLLSRIIGVITSPRATFQNIVAAPRPFAVMFIVATVIGLASIAPQFTEKGRAATIETQISAMERFGATVTPEIRERLEERSKNVPLRFLGLVGTYIFLPVMALVFAAIYWVAFNVVLGGTAAYKQVLAIITHSQVVGAIGILAGLPIIMSTGKMTMAGPFNLGALAPMLEEGSKIATWLGSISIFTLWALVLTSIGLAVLYKRNSRNIAITLIAIYLLIMFGVATFFSGFRPA